MNRFPTSTILWLSLPCSPVEFMFFCPFWKTAHRADYFSKTPALILNGMDYRWWPELPDSYDIDPFSVGNFPDEKFPVSCSLSFSVE
jgi:hypothetical protein